ncbi:hypothetical protein EYF80_006387 [Liparis tanakae]|uniref:Uncharacterized protein n=1 Tax=Liparis tanakae TaxID=230148 RepID=A0A4Z2IZS8_9TELE|nr:hypothetical protein EYF80_006387 [Liparis tanakae]
MKGRCRSCAGPSQLRCKHSWLLRNSVCRGGPCKAWSWGEKRGRPNSTFKPLSALKIDRECLCVCVCVCVESTVEKIHGISNIECTEDGAEALGRGHKPTGEVGRINGAEHTHLRGMPGLGPLPAKWGSGRRRGQNPERRGGGYQPRDCWDGKKKKSGAHPLTGCQRITSSPRH